MHRGVTPLVLRGPESPWHDRRTRGGPVATLAEEGRMAQILFKAAPGFGRDLNRRMGGSMRLAPVNLVTVLLATNAALGQSPPPSDGASQSAPIIPPSQTAPASTCPSLKAEYTGWYLFETPTLYRTRGQVGMKVVKQNGCEVEALFKFGGGRCQGGWEPATVTMSVSGDLDLTTTAGPCRMAIALKRLPNGKYSGPADIKAEPPINIAVGTTTIELD